MDCMKIINQLASAETHARSARGYIASGDTGRRFLDAIEKARTYLDGAEAESNLLRGGFND